MFNIFHPISSLIARIYRAWRNSSVHIKVLAILLASAFCAGAFLYLSKRSDQTFALDYAAYNSAAAQDDNAAYTPGAQNNPVRIAIDQTLTQVLQGQESDAARLVLAQQGLQLLQQSEDQIGEISSSSAQVDTAIAKMQVDILNGFAPSEKVGQIIALAKERESTISDIRAYSYKADFETEQIFQTIVADKGALTQAYIVQLNDEIPNVETEFDKRTELYTQLQSVADQIAQIYASISGLPPSINGPAAPVSSASGS